MTSSKGSKAKRNMVLTIQVRSTKRDLGYVLRSLLGVQWKQVAEAPNQPEGVRIFLRGE